jgi:hypothetical protein
VTLGVDAPLPFGPLLVQAIDRSANDWNKRNPMKPQFALDGSLRTAATAAVGSYYYVMEVGTG